MNIKLQKYMADHWICSRRKAEEFIKEWLVTVNNEIAHIGQRIDSDVDIIKYNNALIKVKQNFVYYKINKPRWIVSTCAQEDERNIVDIVDIEERVFPIWRLDKNTDWLMLLTNDWRLANKLMHPKFNHTKTYIVKTYWKITDKDLDILSEWVNILNSRTKPCKINRISSWMFQIRLTEWKNRQIRRMVEKVWHEVKWLRRIQIENIDLWNLNPWDYKMLSNKEKKELFTRCDID